MSQHLELNDQTQSNVLLKPGPGFPEQEIEGAFSLSPTQAGMLFHSLFAPDAGLYLEQIILRIDG